MRSQSLYNRPVYAIAQRETPQRGIGYGYYRSKEQPAFSAELYFRILQKARFLAAALSCKNEPFESNGH